jgi:hypothetical protein
MVRTQLSTLIRQKAEVTAVGTLVATMGGMEVPVEVQISVEVKETGSPGRGIMADWEM